ncbi:MAG: XRE family transcriptional regulator [Desulfovibrionaceae bacterium]
MHDDAICKETTLEEFLKEEELYEEVAAAAIKRVLTWQLEQNMARAGLTKTDMARRMHTSRSSLNRLLDPESTSLTLDTLVRAATAIGKEVRIDLVDRPSCS